MVDTEYSFSTKFSFKIGRFIVIMTLLLGFRTERNGRSIFIHLIGAVGRLFPLH